MINSIQYLRGLAAVLVVYYHATIKSVQNNLPAAEVFNFGQAGVDLFFIISGFIICFSTDKHTFSAGRFLKSRVLRIIPLYWFFTLLALLVFLVVPNLVNSSGGETVIWKSFFLVPTEDKYLVRNGWTLSYEFYFYFIFALFAVFFIKRSLVFLPLLLLALIGCFNNAHFYFDSYLIEFAMGVISFIMYKNKVAVKYNLILLFFMFFSLLAMHLLEVDSVVFYYAFIMWFIFHGSLVLEQLIKVSKLQSFKNLLFKLGDSSYSLYLSHAFTLVVLNKIMLLIMPNVGKELYLFLLTFISIIVGHLVYVLIELKLNSYCKKLFN
ncbi:acyltransferase [Pseudoalteromonas agarivorans]|uniref:acyltransferase family protein n=1 Tax=Pseudoalteromonas TaxID=53246 RepID=UPI000F764AD9|nr:MULTISPECIES: acyltransferase [Pseudoalteromonas]AZN32442.1 acyltransferase [Pseudoalteromonas sp. Xi13]MCQ8819303.1 acyltransferase [Pseudoalteromonas agarivorans]